jgi:hypothetical protein
MKWGLIAIGVALLAGCAQPPRYEWGRYEDSLYHYYKDPTTASEYLEVLAKAARIGDASGRTAPGVHAEYGYMLLSAGRNGEATQEFESEKRFWPESTVFMDRMLAMAAGGKLPSTAVSAVPGLAGKAGS